MTTLGLDLGGTKILAALVAADGRVIATERAGTRDGGPDAVLAQLAQIAESIGARGRFDAAGVGFPGPVDASRGVARSSVILREWSEVEVATRLGRRLLVPCVVDNDVHQAARAELAARGDDGADFLLVSVGTGIGGALVLDGRLYGGSGGLAGEIGHVSVARDGPACACGRRGCLGALSSGGAIEARLGLRRGELAAAVAAKEPRAIAALLEAAEWLGFGLASVMNLLALPAIVLGGGVAALDGPWLERVRETALRTAFPEIAATTRIERARAGYEAGAIGAALHAREAVKSPPARSS